MKIGNDDDTATRSPLTLRATYRWLILVLIAVTLPYLMAWLTTPEGKVFSWALLNPDDVSVYVSAMNQGAEGKWLYHFTYSPEAWQPRLMLSLYLVLGKITAIFSQPSVIWFHVWRLFLGVLSMGALVFWVRTVFPNRSRWQWTAWFLILFGGGLGWIVAIIRPSISGQLPDIGMAEWVPLLAFINTPHFALGLGLEALVFSCFIRAERAESTKLRIRWAVLGAIAAVLATLVYVYHLAIIGLVIGTYLLFRTVQEYRSSWRHWWTGAIIIAPLIPLLFYYTIWTNDDPYWERYTRIDHVILPPSFWAAVIGLGLLLPLAFAGARYWFKQGRTPLLPIWAIVNFLVLYLPFVAFSGRFGLGLMLPVATLAAVGLETTVLPWLSRTRFFETFSRLTPTPYESLRRVILLLLLPSVLMAVLLLAKGPMVSKEFPYYWPEADVVAAKWLGERSHESDVTLAYYPMGNFLPQVYSGKVFMGQLDFTTELNTKIKQFESFWGGSMSDEERQTFLGQWGINYIFSGTFEAPFQTGPDPPGTVIYQADEIRIFQTE